MGYVGGGGGSVNTSIAATVTFMQRLQRWRWCSDCGNGVGAAITVIALVQLLRRWRHRRSDCGDGGVGAVIAVAASVAAAAALVGAAIAVTAVFLQWLRRWHWLATAIVVAASAQRLWRQRRCSDCGCDGVGAGIVAAVAVQLLCWPRWRSDCVGAAIAAVAAAQ